MCYDVVVLGGGSAGYAATRRAARLGMHVVLGEGATLGGTMLHRGCIPTKALRHLAEVADTVRTATQSVCSAPSAASTCPPSTSSTAASSAVCTRAGDGRSSGVVLGRQRGLSGGSHRLGRGSGGRRQKRTRRGRQALTAGCWDDRSNEC